MRAKISKWGNSLAVRLPSAVVEDAGLKEGQLVDLSAVPGAIRLRQIEPAPHYSLDELLAEAAKLGPENRPAFVDLGILPSEWPQDDWSDIAPTDEEMGISGAGHRRKTSRGR
jgi:antitoxin MazE